MTKSTKKKVNLALQGGGAHGAFTWGILDRFLELNLFDITGISATSAGSMNAVVLAQGLMDGGNEGARKSLHDFWKRVSHEAEMLGLVTHTFFDKAFESYQKAPFTFHFMSSLVNLFSPYELNPFNMNPMRDVLEQTIDVDKLNENSPIKLFICASNVKTGRIRIFKENELSVDAILASACLPKLFQAVEVNGEFYWDGGYLGNPAIFPLIYETDVNDVIILHLVPMTRTHIPRTVMEIDQRLREVSFNSSLMREMRAIAFVTKLIEEGWLKQTHEKRLKKMNMHVLRADHSLSQFPLSSVFIPEWDFLLKLKELGRLAADEWLRDNFESIGKRSTVNFDDWL